MRCGAEVYLEGFRSGIKPMDRLTVDEWADEYRTLPDTAAEPGPYRTSRTPYLKEIMRCLSAHDPTREVVFMKGSQIGGTEAMLCWLGYIMDHNPGSTMMVQPTVDLAESLSKERIASMIETTPSLDSKIGSTKSKDSSNTIKKKKFPGGFLVMSGANSAASLRSRPIRFLGLDEIDAYPRNVGGEGNPTKLAEKRTTTFSRRKKIFKVSTPTYKSASAIEDEFNSSTMERFHLPCPHCKKKQWLKWKQVRWEKNKADKDRPIPHTVHYLCEHCEGRIEEHHKTQMFDDGDWIPEHPEREKRGFHLSALYSPLGWYSWAEMAHDFWDAQGDVEKMMVFVNTGLAETFEIESGETPKWRHLYNRREDYKIGQVPERAVVLLAACDIQQDRIECTITAWNRRESWVVDHVFLPGKTNVEVTEGPWANLADLLATDFENAEGHVFRISRCGIDSGYATTKVYEFVRRHSKCFALKGLDTDKTLQPIAGSTLIDIRHSDGRRLRRGVRLWKIGSSVLKADAYGRFKLEKPTDDELKDSGYPAAYVHFPMLNEEYFKQLTAEVLVLQTNKRGRSNYTWVKTHPNNEALDCFCYNIAAYYLMQCNRWDEEKWRQLESQVGIKTAPKQKQIPGAQEKQQASEPPPRRKSAYWNRRR